MAPPVPTGLYLRIHLETVKVLQLVLDFKDRVFSWPVLPVAICKHTHGCLLKRMSEAQVDNYSTETASNYAECLLTPLALFG